MIYAIQYEIRRAANDELVESGELVLQGEDALDAALQLTGSLLAPEEREEYRVRALSVNKA